MSPSFTPSKHARRAVLAAALVLLTLPPAGAQVVGVTGSGSTLMEFFLSTPGDFPPEGESWTFAELRTVTALERDEAGLFYVLGSLENGNEALYVADPETGVATQLLELDVIIEADLAFDASGLLWISTSDRRLLTYDPATAVLTPLPSLATAREVGGAAWQGGRLLVLLRPDGSTLPTTLATVDPSTGAVSEIRDLPEPTGSSVFSRTASSLDFDDAGGSWIGFVEATGVIDPPFLFGWTAYFVDLLDDPDADLRRIDGTFRGAVPLVVEGSVTAVDVPTSGRAGLALLTALLVALTLARIRHLR